MPQTQYLVRFDDLTPGMNWSVWNHIEDILRKYSIKPILAVVPDNKDEKLIVDDINPHFWQRVQSWQDMGWTIGLHGYQHKYVTNDSGIVGINLNSEFAGLPLEEQAFKIEEGLKIFKEHGIDTSLWIAPSHSFDGNTIRALKTKEVNYISDGLYLYPGVDKDGVIWVPQQMWRFRKLPFGVWTVCFHHNKWEEKDLVQFENDIKNFKDCIVSFDEVEERYGNKRICMGSKMFSRGYLMLLKLKNIGKTKSKGSFKSNFREL